MVPLLAEKANIIRLSDFQFQHWPIDIASHIDTV